MTCHNCDRIRAELFAMTNMWKQAEDGNIELLKSIGAHKAEILELKRRVESLDSLLDESNRLVDGMCENKKGGSHV